MSARCRLLSVMGLSISLLKCIYIFLILLKSDPRVHMHMR